MTCSFAVTVKSAYGKPPIEVPYVHRIKEAEASSAGYQVGVFSDTVPTAIRVCRISSI